MRYLLVASYIMELELDACSLLFDFLLFSIGPSSLVLIFLELQIPFSHIYGFSAMFLLRAFGYRPFTLVDANNFYSVQPQNS